VDSAFGGLGIYRREAFLAGRYAGTDDLAGGIDVADHTPYHRQLRQKGYRIFINPALINCDKTTQDIIESVCTPIPKASGTLKLVKKLGIVLFGKKRFNKYLQIMQTP
jgi:hypothetical protein